MKCWKSLLKVTRISHCVVGHVRNSTDWQRNKGLSHPGRTSKVCSLLTLLGDMVLVHHSSDFPVKSKLCISHVNCVAYRINRYLYHKILWYENTGFNPDFNVFLVLYCTYNFRYLGVQVGCLVSVAPSCLPCNWILYTEFPSFFFFSVGLSWFCSLLM